MPLLVGKVKNPDSSREHFVCIEYDHAGGKIRSTSGPMNEFELRQDLAERGMDSAEIAERLKLARGGRQWIWGLTP
jgi:hypothetical protein